jgi:class I fructose-bisphosphate aldolase
MIKKILKQIKLNKIMKNGKTLLLAYDQGMEHGPTDFNDKNVDPKYIIDIAKKGKFNAIVLQKGIAEKYNKEVKESKIPLILKLNGKTSLLKGDPISAQLATVDEAYNLGAIAVGYTIYIGSIHEEKMFREIEDIQRKAHKKNLPVIVWMYPRGAGTKGKKETELMAYATRVALELGVDMVKVQPHGKLKDIKWAVESAGKVKVICAGGSKENEKELLKKIKTYMKAGVSGLAIGRNIWQSKDPIKLTEKIKEIVFKK